MGEEALSQEQIIALGREMLEYLNDHRLPLTVTTDRVVNMAHGPMVYGLSSHALRLGAVVLDLHENGKGLESMPVIRSLYEIAMTAQWLAQSREAPAAVYNEDLRLRRLLSRDFARSASKVFQEGADKIAHLSAEALETIASGQARHFEQRCNALHPGGAHAYALYRAMSAYVHPGSQLMDQYLVPEDGEEAAAGVSLRAEPADIGHHTWLFLAVASMMWAARALDLMQRDKPHRNYLRGVARALEVPEVLKLTAAALAAEQKAEQKRRRATWKGPKLKRKAGTSDTDLPPPMR